MKLTEFEEYILNMYVIEGKNAREISEINKTKEQSVKNSLLYIYRKLGVNNKIQARNVLEKIKNESL